jgi:hypothetical protein
MKTKLAYDPAEIEDIRPLLLQMAETLAVVLQLPATPEMYINELKVFAKEIADALQLPRDFFLADRWTGEPPAALPAFYRLGLLMADFLSIDNIPVNLYDAIGDSTETIQNLLRPADRTVAEVGRFRSVLRGWYLESSGQQAHYPIAIEAKRRFYDLKAEGMILDIEAADARDAGWDDPALGEIATCVEDALAGVDIYHPDSIRRFYAEMRLFADARDAAAPVV